MAGEAALVLKMEARLRDFERQMDSAAKKANSAAKQIEDRFSKINPKVGAGRDPFAFIARGTKAALPGLAALGAALAAAVTVDKIIQASDAYTQMTNRLKIAGYEGENLKSVFQQLYASAQQQGAPIESLVELFGRLSLVQNQIGLSSQQLISFTDGIAAALKVQGSSATEASGALLQLSQALGGGVVRAEEFNSILEGFPVLAQAAANGIEEAGGSVAKLRQLVNDGEVSSKAFAAAIQAAFPALKQQAQEAATTVGQAGERINNAFVNLVGVFNDTTDASGYLAKGLGIIEFAINDLASAIPQARQELAALAAAAVAAYQQITAAVGAGVAASSGMQLDALKGNIGGSGYKPPPVPTLISKEELEKRGATAVAKADVKRAEEIYTGSEERIGKALMKLPPKITPISLANFPVEDAKGGKKGRGGGGGGGSRAASPDEFAREVEQYQKRTQLLQAELAVVGQNTAAQERAKAVVDLLNAAKQAGIPISESLQYRIEAEANAYGEAAQKLEDARNRIDQLNQFSEEFGSALSNAFTDAIVNGEKLNVVLENLLKQLASMAINSAFQMLFSGQGGQASPFASFLSGILGFGGARAGGGPVAGNRSYLVGEQGPELFVPGKSGMIVPNSTLASAGGGGSGSPIVVNMNSSFSGGFSEREKVELIKAQRQATVSAVQEAIARRKL